MGNRLLRQVGMIGLLALSPAPLLAQGTGRIIGRVTSADGERPLGGARVELVGTTQRVTTSVDGRYSLPNVPEGMASLRILLIGYSPKIVTEVPVSGGALTTQDVTLTEVALQLGEITVTAAVERGRVNAALDEQRTSLGVVNAISAEQISRSPDGDAAAAVQRISGATVQDGKYVFVRGLGDRYTQASLNGARIPSPEPEKKVVPLDLFPSALLEGITASKTFTPDQPGDFAGASVNIRTKEFPGNRFTAFSMTAGGNDASTTRTGSFAPAASKDWLALGAGARSLPAALANTDFTQNLAPSEVNGLINGLRNRWTAQSRNGAPNGAFGATVGGNLNRGGTGVNYLISGTYSATQELLSDQRRALATAQSGAEAEELDRFDGSTGRSSVLWGGIANLSTTLGTRTKLSLNNTYNRTMDNEARQETGYSENLATPLAIERLRYVERSIRSTQFLATHAVSPGHSVDWGITASGVRRSEPDRSEVVYSIDPDGVRRWFGFSNEAAVRTFAELNESSLEAHLNWRIALGEPGVGRALRVGGLYRRTDRSADNTAYSISLARSLPSADRELAPEEIFDGRFTGSTDQYFRIVPLSAGGSYDASDRLAAGYAMLVLPVSARLEFVGGARVERSQVEVASLSSAGEPSLATPEFTDILPSLAMNYRFGAEMYLRASATQTLSRPEYRELSPVLFREVIGFDNVKGNPLLARTLIQNLDVRWEWYPRAGEILSVGLFAKHFDRPIERVYQGTSGTRIVSFVNAKGADNYGVELEARRRLDLLAEPLAALTLFANATIMQSEIQIDPASGAVTSANRPMVGQAPYVINAGLTWTHPSADASATVLFNRVGERITDAGETPIPDVIEQPRNVLDLSLRFPVAGRLAGRLDGRNLLNTAHLVTQGGVIRESYRTGRGLSLGFSWQR